MIQVEVNLCLIGNLDLERSGLKRAFGNHLPRGGGSTVRMISLSERGRQKSLCCRGSGLAFRGPGGAGRLVRAGGVCDDGDSGLEGRGDGIYH